MDPDKNGARKRDREKVFNRRETEVEKASRRLRVVSMGIACKIDLEDEDEEAKGFEEEEHADLTPVVPILQMNVDEVSAFFLNLMKRLLQMETGGGKPDRLWAGKKQPAGRIDDGFTLIVDDKLCFWKIEYSLQAPSTSTTRQPT